jgi:hypothetical protein
MLSHVQKRALARCVRVNYNRRVTKAIIAPVDDDEDRFQGGFVAACLTDCSGYERLRARFIVFFFFGFTDIISSNIANLIARNQYELR